VYSFFRRVTDSHPPHPACVKKALSAFYSRSPSSSFFSSSSFSTCEVQSLPRPIFPKEVLGDAIFRTGHWNAALAKTFGESIDGELVPSQSACSPMETKRARTQRRVALQERMRRRKWLCGNASAGECQRCNRSTHWDHPDMRFRTECWVCGKLVCKQNCSLDEHARPSVTASSSKKQQQAQEQEQPRERKPFTIV